MDAYCDERPGIRIIYRADANLLNSQRMQASRRFPMTTVHDLLFADDYALDTVSESDMQRGIYLFDPAYVNFGLTIDTDKTVIMHQPPPSAAYNAPHIHIDITELKALNNFPYLGTTLSRYIKIEDEVISKASQAFGQLQDHVWNRHALRLHAKLKMY
ncbi:hypothetical protein SprV_0100087400 [Sparganum proliferum]